MEKIKIEPKAAHLGLEVAELAANPSTQPIQQALSQRLLDPDQAVDGHTLGNQGALSNQLLTEVTYAWCAGFLDGEGCVSLVQTRRTCGNGVNYRLRVQVPQNCKTTLLTFQDYIGEPCHLKQMTHRESYTRPIYTLLYDGSSALRLLHKLRPYLVRKGAEADIVFEFYCGGQPTRHFGRNGVPADVWHFRRYCFEALRNVK